MPRIKQPIDILQYQNKKHLTKAEIEDREQSESNFKPSDNKILPPTWLSSQAKKQFKIIYENLKEFDLVTNVDVPMLAMWADAYCDYIQCAKEINISLKETNSLLVDSNKSAATQKTEHPLLSRKKQLSEQIDRIGKQFGLSPISRIQIMLPRNDNNKQQEVSPYEREFGNL